MIYKEPEPLTNEEIETIKKIKIRSKSIAEIPEKLRYWDYNYNGSLKPEETGIGIKNKLIWKCEKGHRWSAIPGTKTKTESGCPVCAGNYVLPGFNDLATKKPELLESWDYTANTVKPNEISPCGTDKIHWICEKGHKYVETANKRAVQGCPYCANRRVLKGFNDFASCYPEFLKYWDYDKNDKKPDEVFKSGTYKAWLKCENGHNFQRKINALHNQKKLCPYCNGSLVEKGINDLESLYPTLMKEWDYSKNVKKPSEVFYRRDEKFHWKCESGHEFMMSPYRRTMTFRGCPICCESKGEKQIRQFLEEHKFNFKPQYYFEDLKDDAVLRFDFAVLNGKKVTQLIEFDGEQHFRLIDYSGKNPEEAKKEFESLQKHDKMKNDYCKKHKIPLIRIKYNQITLVNKILCELFEVKNFHEKEEALLLKTNEGRIGKRLKNNKGEIFEIVAYRGAKDIDVKSLSDGKILFHKRYEYFKKL